MRKQLLLMGFLFALLGCETEIEFFEVRSKADALVVYGELSNDSLQYGIYIHHTTAYIPTDVTQFRGEPVNDANVYIEDNKGQRYTYSNTSAGYYQPQVPFQGKVGNSYQLFIETADGQKIQSSAELLKASPVVKDMNVEFITAPKVEDMKFELNSSILDNTAAEDYYFIKRQDFIAFLTTCPPPPPAPAPSPPCYSLCWRAPLNTTPTLIKDFLLNGQELDIKMEPIPLNDHTQVEVQLDVFSVSKEAFTYWQRQEDQRTLGGGLFDKVPAQIIGNLTCTTAPQTQVLGYFLVGGKTQKKLDFHRFSFLSNDELVKLEFYVNENKTRYPETPLYDCSQAAFVEYNIGKNLPSSP